VRPRTIAGMLIPSGGVGLGADGFGDDFSGDELGFSIKKFVKKAASKAGGGAAWVGKKAGSAIKYASLAPLKLALKAARGATKVLCNAPEIVLTAATAQAGVPMGKIKLFCRAVQVQNFGDIKAMLPSAVKVMAALAASGAVPGAGPALSVVTKLMKIPGLSGADPELQGAYLEEQLAGLYDSIGDDELRAAVLGEASPLATAGPALLLLAGAAVAGFGIYSKARR
jgi:hypothetical protein